MPSKTPLAAKQTRQVPASSRRRPRSAKRARVINYGEELRRRRMALPCTCGKHPHMTQEELGVELGSPGKPIRVATISRWELGGTIEHPGMLLHAMDAIRRRATAAR